MVLTGIVKESRNGDLHHIIDNDYKTKADFTKDLKRNGYIVVAVLNDNDISMIKDGTNGIATKFLKLDFEYVKQCL